MIGGIPHTSSVLQAQCNDWPGFLTPPLSSKHGVVSTKPSCLVLPASELRLKRVWLIL